MATVASMRRVQSGTVPPQLQCTGKHSPRGAFTRLILANRGSSEDLGTLAPTKTVAA